jgi:hypothetical protein
MGRYTGIKDKSKNIYNKCEVIWKECKVRVTE